MSIAPLLKSKLLIPAIPSHALFSQRIRDLHIAAKRIVVITAPSGYGKTTSVLLSLKNERRKIRWYRLEKEDSFLPVFYTHLMETLFAGEDKDKFDCFRTLSSIQNISEEYTLINAQLCQDAASLFKRKKDRIYLVLDDFHNISDNRSIVESVRYFASNMPDCLSIIVISRTETGIFSGKLTIHPDVKYIDEEALRFTKEEAEKLITGTYKLNLTKEEAEQIYEYSEGWIAGLFMICHRSNPLSFNSYDCTRSHQYDEQDKFKQYFSEFLMEIDNEKRIILAKMSILPEFSENDIKEIFRFELADDLIKWLERSNMYIQKFLTRPIKYRFHSLFRLALGSFLNQCFDKNQITTMYSNAADYYARTGELQLAVRFFIFAGKINNAIQIAEKSCTLAFNDGHPERVTSIINEFPEAIIQGNPYLLFFKSTVLININHDQCYNCAEKALIMFSKLNDMSYLMNAFGMIMVIAYQINDFSYLKKAADHVPKLRVALKGGIPLKKLIISFASNVVAVERLKLGIKLYKLVEHMYVPDPMWDFSIWMIKSIVLYRTGRLQEAFDNLYKVLHHPVGLSNDQWRITGLVSCHLNLSLMRNMDKSKELNTELFELGEKYNSDFSRGFAYRMTAFLHFQTRNIPEALDNMEKAANAFSKCGSTVLESAARITLYLWDEESSSAAELAEKANAELSSLSDQEPGHGFLELCQAMTGALYKKADQHEKAEMLLRQSLSTSKRKNSRQYMCGAAMHLADLFYRKKNFRLEQKYLRKWAIQSAKNDYIYFWEMDYPTLVRVCARAVEKSLYPEHMRKIIGLYFGMENAERLLLNPSEAALCPEGFITNSKLPVQAKKSIYVKFFGSFRILIDGIEISETEFKTRKISGILKYILAIQDKPVSRETLAALFWPESDTKSASTSLRVALCELRKVLAKFDMSFESKDALIEEGKNGFYVGTNNVVRTDAHEFSEFYKKYLSKKIYTRQEVDLLLQMSQLYEGNFLEDSPYDEWVSLHREHYKSMFTEVSYAIAGFYIKEGEFKQAEAILSKFLNIDSLNEKACGMLLHIYENTGQSNRADSLHRQFEKRFREEIGKKPDLSYCEPIN